uniref:Uncharacterized protein n=1 Tax=Leptocylindrus danicus TaxID=163516 RepID=A0A7S2KV33_9STRA|mmetsp:Transcript_26906/g.39827  ORF Transcript_26906/g.39827 Transcript_26906/m.39827 type:complete len:120 (+) Transcript_26906:234-593(+)
MPIFVILRVLDPVQHPLNGSVADFITICHGGDSPEVLFIVHVHYSISSESTGCSIIRRTSKVIAGGVCILEVLEEAHFGLSAYFDTYFDFIISTWKRLLLLSVRILHVFGGEFRPGLAF